MPKRNPGNPKLWSVARVRDPRYSGIVVRITELTHDGPLYSAQRRDGRTTWHKLRPEATRLSLGPSQKARKDTATRIALDLIQRIATAPEEAAPAPAGGAPLTLRHLIDRYEVDGLHGRSARYRDGMLSAVKRVAKYLGADLAVRDLKPSDLQRYMAHRAAQGVRVAGQRDLVTLSIVINWAVGEKLLSENPLAEKAMRKARAVLHQPRRPVADAARYAALRAVAGQLPPAFGVLLDLAWHTGHRLSAILGLRWADVSFEASKAAPHGAIRWYAGAAADNKKHEHVVAMNAAASAALARWKRAAGGIARAFVFPAQRDPTRPLDRFDAKRWLRQAERRAKLPHVAQGGWHMFRRGWATARKHLPIQDVADAGGWLDTETPATLYQQPDGETTLRVATFVA